MSWDLGSYHYKPPLTPNYGLEPQENSTSTPNQPGHVGGVPSPATYGVQAHHLPNAPRIETAVHQVHMFGDQYGDLSPHSPLPPAQFGAPTPMDARTSEAARRIIHPDAQFNYGSPPVVGQPVYQPNRVASPQPQQPSRATPITAHKERILSLKEGINDLSNDKNINFNRATSDYERNQILQNYSQRRKPRLDAIKTNLINIKNEITTKKGQRVNLPQLDRLILALSQSVAPSTADLNRLIDAVMAEVEEMERQTFPPEYNNVARPLQPQSPVETGKGINENNVNAPTENSNKTQSKLKRAATKIRKLSNAINFLTPKTSGKLLQGILGNRGPPFPNMTSEEVAAFRALVKASPENKEEALQALLKLNQNFQGKVSISKSGHSRVYFWTTESKLGEGGFKVCYRAIKIGGKEVGATKPRVILQKNVRNIDNNNDAFAKDAEISVAKSKQLQEVAKRAGLDGHFMKYKLAKKNDMQTISSHLAEGGDFTSKNLNRCSRDIKFRRNAMQRLLAACNLMEKNGISHNDLKPDNLFLQEGQLVIGDFGLMSNGKTRSLGGTYGYYPPDLIQYEEGQEPKIDWKHMKELGEVVNRRHDNYSVGVIFLEMMMGRHISSELVGMMQNPSERPVLLNFLNNYQPEMPLFKAIAGLLQPSARDRMSFEQAQELMNAQLTCATKQEERATKALQSFLSKKLTLS